MEVPGGGIIVIGENFNTTRKIKASSPRVTHAEGKIGISYMDLEGKRRMFDVTRCMPEDPNARKDFMIPHIAEACRQKDIPYITWVIKNQELCGAHIIDVCVDELSVQSEERQEWMRWLVKTAQGITDAIIAIDSSDSRTIRAGLDAHDSRKSRPAINSFNLESGRQGLVELARDSKALLFANASGKTGMPQSAEERVTNIVKCMEHMDKGGITMTDRFLDPLVFPIGADATFGRCYLDAVTELRRMYPEAHIFGGHSNVSFGLPERKVLNFTFAALSILAGCDAAMIDPGATSPKELNDFMFAANALSGKDAYAAQYLKYIRGLKPQATRVRKAA